MFINYFDDSKITKTAISSALKKLTVYRKKVSDIEHNGLIDIPEYSLYYPKNFELHETLNALKKQFKQTKHIVLIGIGGSSLGTEAVHQVLDQGKTKLTVLDSVSPYKLDKLASSLLKQRNLNGVVLCIISKSGNTTETLTNATALLDILQKKFGEKTYKQTIIIGNPDTNLMKYGKRKKATLINIPTIIGGRYSVATAVGLIPLSLLGHDTDEFIAGYLDANQANYESVTAENAARLSLYYRQKYPHYNFFAFESRLEKLGHWYRQLFAESLGKEQTESHKKLRHAMLPTISTPTELHSVGQLYLSDTIKNYTDFVTFDDEVVDVKLSGKNNLAISLTGFTMQEIATALYGGVIAAYQEKKLPYRATIFEENLPYSIGLFMGMRLREIMYTAHLLDVNAFNQPNVELYKIKTKEILSV